uniref:Uncharacterized protein n=1 Tax=Rhizophora mucronata TaxID=61149 RepID=A0A2P2PDF1_RHIMU
MKSLVFRNSSNGKLLKQILEKEQRMGKGTMDDTRNMQKMKFEFSS